jgi:3'(2'), 5'-bisphosphate nucleotidase
MSHAQYLPLAVLAAYDAGQAVLEIYNRDFKVTEKEDRSPLTEADLASHRVICEALRSGSPFPILSEESRHAPYEERADWNVFWLVDPLDGTKEFIKRNGEFTVNIALVDSGVPVLGVVFTPVTGAFHVGGPDFGAFRAVLGEEFADREELAAQAGTLSEAWSRLPLALDVPAGTLRVVASRSHRNQETDEFIDRIGVGYENVELVSSGSSLKLCMVAEGSADVYPRIAPTCEWDTAAAHAVVLGAGGTVCRHEDGQPVVYNKPDLLNPHFVVARQGFAWYAGSDPGA